GPQSRGFRIAVALAKPILPRIGVAADRRGARKPQDRDGVFAGRRAVAGGVGAQGEGAVLLDRTGRTKGFWIVVTKRMKDDQRLDGRLAADKDAASDREHGLAWIRRTAANTDERQESKEQRRAKPRENPTRHKN